MRNPLVDLFTVLMRDVTFFSDRSGGIRLRSYQRTVARAIVDSVLHRQGLAFAVMFPRQSGKNELQAQIETYLLMLYSEKDAEIVKISPTWKPQAQTAMRRLERALEKNLVTQGKWQKESGYIYRVGKARIVFLSGSPEAHIVGATAGTLLEVDEAQDILPAKYDKEIAPMAASTNATRVFWGTAWTSETLLARELRAARTAEAEDGMRRAFVITADEVAGEVPAYGAFVQAHVARLGRHHPMVRSQFYSEEVDGEAGMFPPARRALMVGTHPRRQEPAPGGRYAFLLDVAGEEPVGGLGPAMAATREEALPGASATRDTPARDATALTIVEVDLATSADPVLRAPTYRVVDRCSLTGAAHTRLYAEVLALAQGWRPYALVIDATGVGAGLASFLARALPGRVVPFLFNTATKSQLGWDFLAVVETGRFKDWWEPEAASPERALFWRQLEHCRCEVAPGPEKRLRWGVPDALCDPETGELLHDDLLLSAALSAVLDGHNWPSPGGGMAIVRRQDPLVEMDREKF